jgi:hypothetical protein
VSIVIWGGAFGKGGRFVLDLELVVGAFIAYWGYIGFNKITLVS